MTTTNQLFARRQRRTRLKIREKSSGRIRLSVFRSGKHIYAQLIDDARGVTLASASTLQKDLRTTLPSTSNVEAAKAVGKSIAELAKKANINEVVFDRGARRYHGRVKALADGAREGGLSF